NGPECAVADYSQWNAGDPGGSGEYIDALVEFDAANIEDLVIAFGFYTCGAPRRDRVAKHPDSAEVDAATLEQRDHSFMNGKHGRLGMVEIAQMTTDDMAGDAPKLVSIVAFVAI